jgi:hypothetical protein
MKTKSKIVAQEWTETTEHSPTIGQKILVFVWRDETVCQAWWNGKHYILVAADEQGLVNIYQVPPNSISHWQNMPENPAMSNNIHDMSAHKQAASVH